MVVNAGSVYGSKCMVVKYGRKMLVVICKAEVIDGIDCHCNP